MRKNYEITEKQLSFLEGYLKKKKKFLDPEDLYELIDHIILDFETTTRNGNLSQYLADNSSFISNYKGSTTKKESVVHWQNQKELLQEFFGFFYTIRQIPFTIFCLIIIYSLFFKFNLSNKILGGIFVSLISMPMIMSFILTYHKNKSIRRLISFKYLSNIMVLPSMFLYLFSPIVDFLKENRILFFIYFSIAFGLHISGILLIIRKRKIILEKNKLLLN